jgi:hypothetical protein
MNLPPWEPPLSGDEHDAVFAALDRLRVTFRWKAADLDASGLAQTTAASEITLGGLLKHLALMDDWYFQVRILGKPMPEPWLSLDWERKDADWEWESAEEDSPEELYALWDAAASRSRAAVAEIADRGGLDAPAAITTRDGRSPNVRRLVMDMIEEYGRHTGHADILREAVDGRVGEDPDWP